MIILASGSPRRRELLKTITPNFKVVISDIDESTIFCKNSERAKEIARLKAYATSYQYPNDIVIACDTVVIESDEILGKPKSAKEAQMMLKRLSGKKHHVITGYTIIGPGFEINRNAMTEVFFNQLDDALIDRYVASGSPLDKAGAYGIQDRDFPLVHHISGSFTNVMGFPLEEISKYLSPYIK